MAKISNYMKKMGFTNATDILLIPRIVMALTGMEGQGKTHFSLTAPGPISLLNLDEGLESVINKHSGDKDIHVLDITIPNVLGDSVGKMTKAEKAEQADVVQEEAEAEWIKFNNGYQWSLKSNEIRSIVIDTASELRELQLMAHFGKTAEIMPYMYRGPNTEFRRLIRDAIKSDKNVIFISKMKPIYLNDKRTGEYEPAGFKDTGYNSQVSAQIYQYSPKDGGEFVLWIKKCRQNPDLAGEELEGPMCDFQTLAMLAMPGMDPEVWE